MIKAIQRHPRGSGAAVTQSPSQKFAYGVTEAAGLVSISRSQLYVEIQAGRLSAIKIGGRTLVTQEDLLTWLKSRPRKRDAEHVERETPSTFLTKENTEVVQKRDS